MRLDAGRPPRAADPREFSLQLSALSERFERYERLRESARSTPERLRRAEVALRVSLDYFDQWLRRD